MEAKELREKTREDLQKMLDEKRGSLSKFHFDLSFGKNKNVRQGSVLKKDIARILTVITQKENE